MACPAILQVDSPFLPRQAGAFGYGQDVQAQYGGLFYSAAPSSMVGRAPPSSRVSKLSLSHAPAGHSSLKRQMQFQSSMTEPSTPSTAISFNLKNQADAFGSALGFLDSPTPSVLDRDHRDAYAVDEHASLLASSSSSPFTSSVSSNSHSGDDTFSPFSSTQSSPHLRDAKLLKPASSSIEMTPNSVSFNLKPTANRFFGSYQSQAMHEDSDSAFTTDFSSSEDEAFPR